MPVWDRDQGELLLGTARDMAWPGCMRSSVRQPSSVTQEEANNAKGRAAQHQVCGVLVASAPAPSTMSTPSLTPTVVSGAAWGPSC